MPCSLKLGYFPHYFSIHARTHLYFFRDAMRSGESDEDLLTLIGNAVQRKHPKHAGLHTTKYINFVENISIYITFVLA